MHMEVPEWACLGPGPAHVADVEEVERVPHAGPSELAVHRCRRCGQLYRFHHYELNDWSASGDFCDDTYVWQPLAPDEVAAFRDDAHYQPRSDRMHNYQTGWR